MLLADNGDLAAALQTGQQREVTFTLRFDWTRDGSYSNGYVNFDDNVESVTLDAQFTGNYPAAYEINDGYAQRRLTVTAKGSVNGVSVVKFFSPFGGYYGGQIGAVNTPCYFEVNVLTASGPVAIRQFTGYLVTATPSRSDGTVTIEIADPTSQLTNPISILPYARSQALAQWSLSGSSTTNNKTRQRGGTSLSWYTIDACRKCGMYQGPKPPSGAVAYWTLTGGVLPEVGTMNQQPRDGRQSWPIADSGSWIMSAQQQTINELPEYYRKISTDPVYPIGPWSPDVETPELYPRYMWQSGLYGPEMLYDVYDSATSSSGGVADVMRWIGTTSDPVVINPTGSNQDRLGIGGWIRLDNTKSSTNVTSVTVMLMGFSRYSEVAPPDAANDHTVVSGPEAYAQFTVNPSTKGYTVYVSYSDNNSGTVGTWQFDGTLSVANGLHYVACNIGFRASGAPILNFNLDGTASTLTWDRSGGTYPVGKSVYAQADGRNAETSGVQIATSGGAQHWGVWQNRTQTSSTPLVWSNGTASMDYIPATNIGPSLGRVMWSPSVSGTQAWDVIKAIGSADLGVIYTDEYGIINYANFDDIQAARDTVSAVAALTLDEVQTLDPYTSFDSVANIVTYQSQDKYFIDTAIFSASDPQQFTVPKNGTARWQLRVENAMSILPGSITPRRLAQGYWSTTTGSGDNPGSIYTYQDFMRAYAPDHWKNGFTSHVVRDYVNTAGTQAQPSEGTGSFAFAVPGWAAGDLDPTHITVILQGGSSAPGTPIMAAIDDNTAFLNIRGYSIQSVDALDTSVPSTNASSFTTFGSRVMSRPTSDWASDYFTQHDLSQFLADDLATPKPVLESLDVLGDPRRQLQDVIRIDDPGDDAIGGPIYASIVGINRTYSTSDGIKETLTLRTFGPRGGSWVLGDSSFSQLGSTTILSS